MTMLRTSFIICFCISLLAGSLVYAEEQESSPPASKLIISSGAFTKLPPGSLVSLAVAIERGVQAIKLDLVLSQDNQVMVLSTPRLNDATNISQVFPDRARDDGSYLSVDFSEYELKGLVRQPDKTDTPAGNAPTIFTPQFPVISLDDALGYMDMIQLDPDHKPVIICELRQGWLHRREGKDLAGIVYSVLEDYRLRSGNVPLFLASYNPEELEQLAEARENVTGEKTDFIQLIGTNNGTEVKTLEFGNYQPYNFDLLFTKFGLKAVSTYAAAIGLHPETIFNETGDLTRAEYLENARTLGIKLILYGEAADLEGKVTPPPSDMLEYLFTTIGFDAVLTDDVKLLSSQNLQTEGKDADDNQDNTIERLIKQIESSSKEQPSSDTSDTTW